MSWAFQPLLPAAAQLGAGGGAATLTAAAGSFTLAGEAVGLFRSPRIAAAQASFVLTGEAAALIAARLLPAGIGNFALNGEAAALKAARLIAMAHGSFSLSGKDAILGTSGDRTLIAAIGGFALNGQAASFIAPVHASTVAQAVQLAVHDLLIAALPAVTIYDYPAPDAVMPFAVIASQQVKPDDSFAQFGYRHALKIEFWSNYRGQKEVLELLDTAWLTLHNARLNLGIGHAIVCRCASQETALDNDGLTRRGDLTVNVRTMAA